MARMTNQEIKTALKALETRIKFVISSGKHLEYNYLLGKRQAFLEVLGFHAWSDKKQQKFIQETKNKK